MLQYCTAAVHRGVVLRHRAASAPPPPPAHDYIAIGGQCGASNATATACCSGTPCDFQVLPSTARRVRVRRLTASVVPRSSRRSASRASYHRHPLCRSAALRAARPATRQRPATRTSAPPSWCAMRTSVLICRRRCRAQRTEARVHAQSQARCGLINKNNA